VAVIATPNATTISPQCPSVLDNALAITPSDVDTFARGVTVYVGVAGTVSCVPWGGNPAVTVTAVAGALLPFRVVKVNATDTTATGLLAVY
jgi:hypothetical protein